MDQLIKLHPNLYQNSKTPRSLHLLTLVQNGLQSLNKSNIDHIENLILKSDLILNPQNLRALCHVLAKTTCLFTNIQNDYVTFIANFSSLLDEENAKVFKDLLVEELIHTESDSYAMVYKIILMRKLYVYKYFDYQLIKRCFERLFISPHSINAIFCYFLAFASEFADHDPALYQKAIQKFIQNETLNDHLKIILLNFPLYRDDNYKKLQEIFSFGMEIQSIQFAIFVDDVNYIKVYCDKKQNYSTIKIWFSPLDYEETPPFNLISLCVLYKSVKCFNHLCDLTENKILDELDDSMIFMGRDFNEEIYERIKKYREIDFSKCIQNCSRFRNDKNINKLLEICSEYDKKTLNKAYLNACYYGNLRLMFYLLFSEKCVEADFQDHETGDTAFSIACRESNISIINYFLIQTKYKIDLNPKDSFGRTPLIVAAKEYLSPVLRILNDIDEVDVNAKDNDGNTALMYIVKNMDVYNAKILLENEKVNPNLKTNDGNFPLRQAVIFHDENMVELLVNLEKIDMNNRDGDGSTVVFQAVCHNLPLYINLFLQNEKTDPNITGKNGFTPLSVAAISGQTECVREILNSPKTDINQRDSAGNTAIITACSRNNIEMVKLLLLYKNVNINARGYIGNTALITASLIGSLDIVKCLVESRDDININLRNDGGNTPLQEACKNKRTDVVEYLLSLKDINVNSWNKKGEAAITITARLGDYKTMGALLNYPDIDANITNDIIQTPLAFAIENNHIECVKVMLNSPKVEIFRPSPPDSLTSIFIACSKGFDDIVKLILNSPRLRSDFYPGSHVKYLFDASIKHPNVIKVLEEHGLLP